MTNIILKTEKLKKVIGKKTIVEDISLELSEGEIFGFLGPNGAGKTTTIKMIVGLSKITEGDIYIAGYSVKKEFKKAMANVGCIVENPELYKYMSGFDNLCMLAKMYPNVDKARIDEVVKIVDLQNAINNKVKTYSLGMKQRLGIAQALLHRPKLLILDEPTNGLDPAGIKQMRELLRKLAKEEKLTVFVSSHILSEMQQMCDRVCIINKGRIVTVKTVSELTSMTNNSNKSEVVIKTNNNEKAVQIINSLKIKNSMLPDGIHAEAKKENIPQIINELSKEGISIFGVDNKNTSSLEDVFMKLTEGEDRK